MKYLPLFFLCLLYACHQKNLPAKTEFSPPSSLLIESLQVLNLSEDMSAVSTKNDEVVLNVFLLKQQDQAFHLADHYFSPAYTFMKKGEKQMLDKTLPIPIRTEDRPVMVFTLTELDEENSISAVQQILKREIETGRFLKRVDNLHFDTLLGYDDFLGLHYFKLWTLEGKKDFELIFKGRQLFDKFDYRLKGSFKF